MRLILIGVRIAADWLAHPTHGADALRRTLPREAADGPAPTDPIVVADSTREERTARRMAAGADAPDAGAVFLRVAHYAGAKSNAQPMADVRACTVPLLVTAEISGAVTAAAYTEALYLLDAALVSLDRLDDPAYAAANGPARLRLGVEWVGKTSLLAGVPGNERQDTTTVAALMIEADLQDQLAGTS